MTWTLVPATLHQACLQDFHSDVDLDFTINDTEDEMTTDDVSEKLYTSSVLSVQQTLALLFVWFSSFPGISKEAFGKLLSLLQTQILPQPNHLPKTYDKAHALVKKNLMPMLIDYKSSN